MKTSSFDLPEDAKRVGIWIRVSTEDQAKGESPEHHEHRARHYAQAKGWNVVEVYHLEGVSGKRLSDHPETQRMLNDIRRGHLTALIFSKLARLARNTAELLQFADIFRASGADLVSLHESIDTSTPAGRLFYTMLAAMAQWEREEITERVVASVPIRAKLGKPLGGFAPFGYQWKDKRLVIDPVEAPVRKLIYELFLKYRRKKAVANHLNKAGYRTRKGAKFCGSTVGRLIEDTVAKGKHRSNYSCRTATGDNWQFKPESEWVYNDVEPIVSEELWEQCNAILRESCLPSSRPASRRSPHLFAGIVQCVCGDKMYVPSNSPKYTCRTCRNKIPVTDLEEVFYEQLKSFLVSSADVDAFLGRAQDTVSEKQQQLHTLKLDAEKTRRDIEKTHKLYLEGHVDAATFAQFAKPLKERLTELDEEIPRIEADIDFLKVNSFSADQVRNDANHLEASWPVLSLEEKRQIVECITEKITVDKGEISIDLLYIPSSKELTTRNWSLARAARTDEIVFAAALENRRRFH